ncbi:hypothetical protein PC118_g4594 [Phytophthora cactorum]|uniref:Uncharacterized protein n=1 Tax=Phytophthora cactorum TaxID=29920 RepID=A0A8T1GA26_9STRA|nr:hypothetical protein PC118_g4594 [Phytophthora cactorum]
MVWALFVRRVTYADPNALNITWRFFEQYSRKTRGETRWLSSLKVLQWLEDVWDFPRKSSLFAATKLSKLQCAASSSLRPVKPPNISKAARDFYAVPKNPHKSIHYNASGSETGPAASMTFLAP